MRKSEFTETQIIAILSKRPTNGIFRPLTLSAMVLSYT